MKSLLLTTISLMLFCQIIAQKETKFLKTAPLTIGEKVEFRSGILKEDRLLNIYLPNGYSKDSDTTYPVIYLLDGSIDEDFIHISGLVQFGSFSWINMIPESIVVGVSNVDRKRDFTYPSNNKRDQEELPTSGKSEAFVQFIEKELQPLIEAKYKTDSIKTLIGQSLGGLLSTEILMKQPDLFDNYIIVSPSLWWDDESLLKDTPAKYSSDKSIYIGVGKEGQGMEEAAEALYNKLKLIKKENTNLYFEYFEQHDHGDVLHSAVYNAFDIIFKKDAK
jgi:predicted alpha/beta superfamily hydrolase